jgi:aminoglycoside phosphotransferase (APT) family kinase protein
VAVGRPVTRARRPCRPRRRVDTGAHQAKPAAEHLDELFGGWAWLAERGGADGLDPWAASHLHELADLESGWPEASSGETLLHADVRSDNILLTSDGVVFVDWPHACVGAAWLDLLAFLPSVAMQGGPPPWELFDAHPVGREAPPDLVLTLPEPRGLPTLREFQGAQGVEALAWLRRSLGES